MYLLPVLLQLSLIHILMAMVPGPNTVVVGYCSAGMSRGAGLAAASGVAAASLIWVCLSLAGIGALLMHAGDLFRMVRLAGAAYLCWVGVRMLLSASVSATAKPAPVYRSPFRAGFLTTLSNPKSAIFWTGVFAVLLPTQAPAWFYVAVVAMIGAQSLGWYGTVAMTLSAPFSRRHYARLAGALGRIAGACMLYFGLKIANDLRMELAARAA